MAAARARRRARRGRRPTSPGGVRVSAHPRIPDPHAGEDVSLTAALPGLARIAAAASIRLVEWTAVAYVRTGSRLLRAAAAGDPPAEVLQQTGDELLAYLRDLLGVREDGREAAP